jgi:hypothetical protein
MNKESIIELQKIDCNCNNCGYMVRNMDKFKESLYKHLWWQADYFTAIRNNLYKKAEIHELTGFSEKANIVRKMADKMRFQFDKSECAINYGDCSKFKKPVSFIPNICQVETQECFKHRREF